jgi:nucleoid DNA-binding protein
MKSKQLVAQIASTCNLRQETAAAVVEEVFRQIRAALDSGERVEIPDFGNFISREVSGEGGEPGKRVIRFRPPLDDAAKQARAQRRQERAGKGEDNDEDED